MTEQATCPACPVCGDALTKPHPSGVLVTRSIRATHGTTRYCSPGCLAWAEHRNQENSA